MSYTFNSTDVFDFASSIGAETRRRGGELFFKRCPYCGEAEGNFSVNLETGAFKCFRATCGKQGHFVELCRDFNYQLDFGEVKEYRKLTQPKAPIEPTSRAIAYLALRGIDDETAKRYGITTRKDNKNNLVFPFFDETGAMQFIKYRNIDPNNKGAKEWCEKDTKPIFFGMKQCVNFDRLIITEGQIDSLTLAACGFDNCISVSNGANSVASNVANCYEWIKQFKEIIVFGDWEYHRGDKMTLLDDLTKRLPRSITIKAVQKKDYLGEKDANDILRKYGPDAVKRCIENAVVPPVSNVKDLADVEPIDLSSLPKIKTNINQLDRLIGGIYYGQVVLLTGKRGEGKSTLMSQIVAEAIDQDVKVFAYSGELPDYHFKRWLDLQIAGSKNIKTEQNEYGDSTYSIPKDVIEHINRWYRGKAFIYDNNAVLNNADDELEGLTVTIENVIQRYGVKLVCIDNLMTALDVNPSEDLYRAQSKFVYQLKQIATKYDVSVILVAHPKKSKEAFQNDDVSGSADITNRVDVVMAYERNKSNERKCDGLLSVTKNRLTGILTGKDPIELYYNKQSKRIAGLGAAYRTYGWEISRFVEISPDEELPF